MKYAIKIAKLVKLLYAINYHRPVKIHVFRLYLIRKSEPETVVAIQVNLIDFLFIGDYGLFNELSDKSYAFEKINKRFELP